MRPRHRRRKQSLVRPGPVLSSNSFSELGVVQDERDEKSDLSILSWNARGLQDSMFEVVKLLRKRGVALACFMETGLYGKDPDNTAEYYWIGGPELLPHPGFADPRRGLGMLASKDQLPGGVEIRELRGEHSMWSKFPSRAGQVPLYVCCTHVHLASQPLLRAAAFKEITSAVETLKSKGMIIVVGDFNSRAAMNGDTVKDTAGDRFLSFASTNELTVVNSLDLCEGNFTRIQDRLRYNKEGEITSRVDKTTIDYVLIHEKWRHKVNRLQILEKADLDSDHCPLLLSLAWTGARIEPATSIQAAPLRKVIKVVGCPSRVANKWLPSLHASALLPVRKTLTDAFLHSTWHCRQLRKGILVSS